MSPSTSLGTLSSTRPGKRIGSVFGLVGLVRGIPVVLIIFHATPPLAPVGHFITQPSVGAHSLINSLDDAAIAKIFISVAWIVWLWLLICVAIEGAAAVRGRPPLHLPASGRMQSLAAALVGASMTVLPMGRDVLPMRFHAASTPIQVIAGNSRQQAPKAPATGARGVVPEQALRDGVPRGVRTSATEADSLAPSAMSYVVRPGDTLWSIASKELGSPLQWRAIAELNYGRPQADGDRLTDAHWIFPGWRLALPVAPTEPVVPAGPAGPAGPTADTAAVVAHVHTSGDNPPSSRLIRPGLEAAARTTNGAASSGDQGDHATAPDHGSTGNREAERARDKADTPPPSSVPFRSLGYGILGAGVITLLDRMRRVQRRHRTRGLRIALPEGDLAELERRLRAGSDPEGVEAIDLGLRALVVNCLRSDVMPPRVTMIRLRDRTMEIVLDPASDGREAPPPFRIDSPSTMTWVLAREQTILQELREDPDIVQMDAPFPSLVTIGRDDLGLVMVDLEQAASLDLTGTDSQDILGTAAVEIATAEWADQVDLVLVGFDGEFESLERVSHVATINDIVPRIQRRVRERRALLASVGRDSNWEIRWTEGGDAWDLCVVICASRAVADDPLGAATLVELAGSGGKGLAVVLGSATPDARWHLDFRHGQIEMEASGSVAAVVRAEPEHPPLSAGVASLVQVATQLDGVALTEPPYDTLAELDSVRDPGTGDRPDEALATGSSELRDFEDGRDPRLEDGIEVRVLGPVEIAGAARPFTRAWAVELVVYLAMHRRGASSEQWATALWPDKIMAAASLHSTASAARRSLGASSNGDDHLPRAHGRLALAPTVRSDWSRFLALSQEEDPQSWRRAMELIRGRPFDGLRAPDWVLLEGISANVEAVVVDLASRYAEYCLSAGDPSEAEWSARQGLRVSAYDERLYRILLKAADKAGNPAGVESVMAELIHLVAEDVEPFDAVHPETLELYRSLSRRPSSVVKP